MSLDDFFLFFQSEITQNILAILKPTSFLAIIIFLSAIIWSLKKSPWLYWYFTEDAKDFFRGGPIPLERKARIKWQKIKKRLKSKKEDEWKLAVIEGAEIVEEVFVRMGYKAENLRARLSLVVEGQIPNLKDLFSACEVYENIISDPDYKLEKKGAQDTIGIFEEFLKYFNYL